MVTGRGGVGGVSGSQLGRRIVHVRIRRAALVQAAPGVSNSTSSRRLWPVANARPCSLMIEAVPGRGATPQPARRGQIQLRAHPNSAQAHDKDRRSHITVREQGCGVGQSDR
ncbi:hypothetical protein AXG93_412s1320 [Marchantia polymorpha subsp. ruderalis]|uniref:Uncharacterized protein n=1 Tax=Marchantia polymorpha subsp. ruderalis TaxID=1480154 RepID=A0A176VPC1_MARPO|nr:hypothetical protein AXG93_412s1320 [Marchantia polymorpha subsp. ruderalis]